MNPRVARHTNEPLTECSECRKEYQELNRRLTTFELSGHCKELYFIVNNGNVLDNSEPWKDGQVCIKIIPAVMNTQQMQGGF